MNDGAPKSNRENPYRTELFETPGVTPEMADQLEAAIIQAGGDIYPKYRTETFDEDYKHSKEPIRNLATDFRIAAMRVLKETIILDEDMESALRNYGDTFAQKLVADAVRPPSHDLDRRTYGIGRARTAHISTVNVCTND